MSRLFWLPALSHFPLAAEHESPWPVPLPVSSGPAGTNLLLADSNHSKNSPHTREELRCWPPLRSDPKRAEERLDGCCEHAHSPSSPGLNELFVTNFFVEVCGQPDALVRLG